MFNKKQKTFNSMLTAAFVLLVAVCGCQSSHSQPTTNHPVASSTAAQRPLENGVYAILREAPTPQEARVEGRQQLVLTYDRRTYSGAPANEPLTYVAIDPKDYIPFVIEGATKMKIDDRGHSELSVSLARKNVKRAEDFTRAHLGGRIAMVVDGEIVTLHKVRSVITDGKVQIARCTDNACEVIRSKLVK